MKQLINKPYKLAIAMSGGIDSLTAYYWALEVEKISPKNIICIMFDYGQEYFTKEIRKVRQIPGIVCEVLELNLAENTTWYSPYSPNRNAIFATICSRFADEVWICANKGDNNKYAYDKNSQFFELASMFNSCSTGKQTIVKSPFINMYKHEIIKWGLAVGVNYDKSVSCYHPTHERCGLCADCFSRFINMMYNKRKEKFFTIPYESDVAINTLAEYTRNLQDKDFSKNKKEVIDITFKVMKKVGDEIVSL